MESKFIESHTYQNCLPHADHYVSLVLRRNGAFDVAPILILSENRFTNQPVLLEQDELEIAIAKQVQMLSQQLGRPYDVRAVEIALQSSVCLLSLYRSINGEKPMRIGVTVEEDAEHVGLLVLPALIASPESEKG